MHFFMFIHFIRAHFVFMFMYVVSIRKDAGRLPFATSYTQPSTFHSQPEELQLYYQVMRKFQTIFRRQEQSTSLHTYDKLPNGNNGSAKRSKSKLLFRKPSNWVKFVKVKPTPDPVQISAYAKIRQRVADVDPVSVCNVSRRVNKFYLVGGRQCYLCYIDHYQYSCI